MTLTVKQRLRQQIDIKNRLEMAGYTLRDIDRAHNLPKNSANRSLYEPNIAAEEAIAVALGVKPHTLWKERYDQTTGLRHTPQPQENYERLPSVKQRRKGVDQLKGLKRTRKKQLNKKTRNPRRQKVAS